MKGNMCSPAIATQAEDLIAGGVKELIHVGFAGGLQPDMRPGEIVITDGAYNDTAVARLYGYDFNIMEASKELTDRLCKGFTDKKLHTAGESIGRQMPDIWKPGDRLPHIGRKVPCVWKWRAWACLRLRLIETALQQQFM